jgi:hypothetical protein
MGDLPAFVRRLAQIGIGIGGVDASGFAALGIVEQEAVVVVETGELVDFEHGGVSLRPM